MVLAGNSEGNNGDHGAGEIRPILITDEMKRSYLDYAMSVIVSRALPDVRDGLKPVHRRILYSMHENGYQWNKPYRKSARIIGDVASLSVKWNKPLSARLLPIAGKQEASGSDGGDSVAFEPGKIQHTLGSSRQRGALPRFSGIDTSIHALFRADQQEGRIRLRAKKRGHARFGK